MNRDGTETEAERKARMRELAKRGGKRSGEARRRKAEARAEARRQAEQLEPPSDRDQAKAALRRALDSNNAAAQVAAAQWLIKFDTSPDREDVTVEDARAQLFAKLDQIEERRRAHGETCAACGGAAYIVRSLDPTRAHRTR